MELVFSIPWCHIVWVQKKTSRDVEWRYSSGYNGAFSVSFCVWIFVTECFGGWWFFSSSCFIFLHLSKRGYWCNSNNDVQPCASHSGLFSFCSCLYIARAGSLVSGLDSTSYVRFRERDRGRSHYYSSCRARQAFILASSRHEALPTAPSHSENNLFWTTDNWDQQKWFLVVLSISMFHERWFCSLLFLQPLFLLSFF